jgi:putative phosphoribosyl transferase
MDSKFRDRREAGGALAHHLLAYASRHDVLVLALPRGGVPVAFAVAQSLHAPLDVFVVRKLGVPGHEELAMGALGSGGAQLFNRDLIRELQLAPRAIDQVVAEETRELERRERRYRGGRPFPTIAGRTIIIVDDGMATGATMLLAARALGQQRPASLVVAVPVGSPEAVRLLGPAADEVVCLRQPQPFQAVGLWYDDFSQTTDQEVLDLLEEARHAADQPLPLDRG